MTADVIKDGISETDCVSLVYKQVEQNYEQVGGYSLFAASGTYFDIGTSRLSQVNGSLCKCNLEFWLMRCVWP